VCKELNLQLVGSANRNKLCGKSGAWELLNQGYDLNKVWKDQEIAIHWWENHERLEKVLERL